MNRLQLIQRPAGPPEWRLWPRTAPDAAPRPAPEVEQPASTRSSFADPGIFTNVRTPSLFVYPSARPNGAALLMAPGGGFVRVSIGSGSGDIARRLNARGVSVFMLKYRLPGNRWAAGADALLQDAQRSLRLIRTHAAHFHIDPQRIGVIGFSAGGYVANALAARHDARVYTPMDAADRTSAAPNIAAILYGPTALDQQFTEPEYRDRLLGADASTANAAQHSPYHSISANAPPTFLAHATDDGAVTVDHTLATFRAYRAAGAPVEMHVYETGGHGISIGPLDAPRSWLTLFLRWAEAREWCGR